MTTEEFRAVLDEIEEAISDLGIDDLSEPACEWFRAIITHARAKLDGYLRAKAEACLVTMTAALADLDITGDGRASVFVSSKLFPEQPDGMSDDEVRVFDHVKGDFIVVKTTPSEMHGIDYETAESIHVTERDRLHDDFEILSVHESGLAYCFCGSITMGDVRRAAKLLWGPGR